MEHLRKPKLRNVNVQPTVYQGEPVFVIQDGLRLTEAAIVLPQALGPLALLCDGEHTLSEMQAKLEVRYGLRLAEPVMENLIQQFDQALLLEGDTFNQTRQQAIREYRSSSARVPALAGPSYPADPNELGQLLQGYLDDIDEVISSSPASRGIISPHIDFSRGGPVYARVWAGAAGAVREAELIIALGTDHNGGFGTLTLTPQNYASPLGVMPTEQELVGDLARILGPENAYAEELHHRGEHSLELVLVWLQYMRGGKPCPMVPILTGSFYHFMTGEAHLEAQTEYKEFVGRLRQEMQRRRTVIVASGDLAHLGPAFSEPALDAAAQAQMKIDDEALLENLCQGDAGGFFDFMKAGQYRRNVCGLSPFYFTMSLLGQTRGQTIAYDRCPADNNNTSFVSVCGLVWQ